jgi:glycosyltransferase involved in cell wall biosynthesis
VGARPLISVVVPVYGVEPWIDRCVESLLAQTLGDFEALLVDDGSPDGCGAKCDAWAAKDARVLSFHKSNGGLSDARNFGIDRARGDFIAFVDPDDWVAPDYLEYLRSLFDRAPSAQYVECGVAVERGGVVSPRDESGRVSVLTPAEAMELTLYDDRLFTGAWGKLFRREAFASLRFPKGRLYEEIWIAADYMPASPATVFGGRSLYFYSIRPGSITTSAFDPDRLAQHTEAADRLSAAAERLDSALAPAARRFRAYSRLRTLRIMSETCGGHRDLRERLRAEVLSESAALLADPKVPRRDKAALRLLRVSFFAYALGWRAYGVVRSVRSRLSGGRRWT